ncbi:sensor histidine kinase [Pleomorphovibrio marinus]|uniref:sensor histidine kinase n=1 Tax=Pleomorphovibrio marinus TaxID=2164132 RepID=UPI001300427B|nr:histidine kinase [Pleomorphovibrio marinus]
MAYLLSKKPAIRPWNWVIGTFLFVLLSVSLLWYYGLDLNLAVVDSMVFAVILLGAALLLANLFTYYNPTTSGFRYHLLFPVIFGFSTLFLGRSILLWLDFEESGYREFLDWTVPLRLVFMLLILYGLTIVVLWKSQTEKENKLKERELLTEKISKDAELYFLRQQLQPHFLFNSLNSISALIGSKPDSAREMIQQLADFFRLTVQKNASGWESLEKEWERISLYLKMEKVRFGHRLSLDLRLDEKTLEMQLPPLLMQPLVENAVKHGLDGLVEKVNILIETFYTPKYLQIKVCNPFDPEVSGKKGAGFGLESVNRRLFLLFGRKDLLTCQTSGNLFIVMLKIPQRQ